MGMKKREEMGKGRRVVCCRVSAPFNSRGGQGLVR